ncbi:hypothetical protein [Bacillus sp. KS1]|uniref:hypothetical protein n=1 Tax=Bacillus sp. KS1 TaxID=2748045 RepID=UPI00295E9349|nr:hypothetical protein [Bacillus sp. KS1]
MAKSKTKKMREHLKRNGMRDAVLSRGTAPSFSTHERVTKTKKDRLERIKHKKRNPYDHRSDDGGSFLCRNLAPFYDFSVMFSLFFHTIY